MGAENYIISEKWSGAAQVKTEKNSEEGDTRTRDSLEIVQDGGRRIDKVR